MPALPPSNAPDFDDLDYSRTIRASYRAGMKLFHDRFTLTREVGSGGMGVVWLAQDNHLGGVNTALKFLPPAAIRDDAALDDMRHEVLRSRRLTHLHIVRVNDFLLDEDVGAIAMEFVDGHTLSKLRTLQPGRVFEASHPHLLSWLLHVCEALEYAHTKARLIHRDIKPGNIMVDAENNAKLTDFGISRSISDTISRQTLGHSGQMAGTPAYMSPQHLMGMPPSISDDIYAFGATMYELLTSKPPFYTGDIVAQVRQMIPSAVSQRRIELGIENSEVISPKLEQLVSECLSKNAADRPPSFRELGLRLKEAVRASDRSPEPLKPEPPQRRQETSADASRESDGTPRIPAPSESAAQATEASGGEWVFVLFALAFIGLAVAMAFKFGW